MMNEDIVLQVEGMTCSNCAAGISKKLKQKGFEDADANFINGEVSFSVNEKLDLEEAIDHIEDLGYKVIKSQKETSGFSRLEKRLIMASIFTIPLFLHMFFPKSFYINHPLVQIALCTPVYFIGFVHFGKSAWNSLKGGVANMDVLIFIGSTAAFLYSLAGTIVFWGQVEMHNYMFFETAATIITLVLLGNVMEQRAVKKTGQDIGKLEELENHTAKIILQVGSIEKIFESDVSAVKKGDIVLTVQGDSIPVDGKIVKGDAYLDTSALTGESLPVLKSIGEEVHSGSLVIEGQIRIEAIQTARNSTLQKILSLIKAARRDQPDIQILGDKISSIFVPVVLGVSFLTFSISYWFADIALTRALMNSIAVLVISCPCAMGLATPTAVVAGIGRAARKGILIKGGSTLEKYAKVDLIAFDKTGTLTTGTFEIESVDGEPSQKEKDVIVTVESSSNHPIAKSFLHKYSDGKILKTRSIREIKSEGVYGVLEDGTEVYLGKSKDADLELRVGNAIVNRFKIKDQIRPHSYEMIEYLKNTGRRSIIISGDKKDKVEAAALKLEIGQFYFGLNPEEKLNLIKESKKNGLVAMVGDGINDGPSLAAADVGVSHGGASNLAVDASKVVLLNKDTMKALKESIQISSLTYSTIKQNLFWAFAYNVVAIPIAALGFLNPMIAALAMALSDVIVIGNSIRLRYRKLR